MKNSKGVSAVVATVLLVAITMAVVGIVWVVVNNIVQKNIKTTEACGVTNDVQLDPLYTCYNGTTGSNNKELWFAINVGDVENLEDIIVSISGQGTSDVFKMKENNPGGLYYFNRTKPLNMNVPGKGSGQAYIYKLLPTFTQTPDSIEIAPIINGETCAVSSSITQFDDCSALA